jgi:antitoxin component HigA of HigAB toxin-antitoxin module
MNIKPIKTEVDYKLALKRLEKIFDSTVGTLESDEADIQFKLRNYAHLGALFLFPFHL